MARTAPGLKRRRYRPGLLAFAGGIAIGLFIGLVIAFLSGSGAVSARVIEIILPISIFVGFFIVGALLLAILVHELGHVLAGLAAGFEFRSMMVGPFEVRSGQTGLGFGVVPNRKASGNARMIPRTPDRLVSRMLLFVSGGPIASLIWCFVTYEIYLAFPKPPHGAGTLPLAVHLGAFCLIGMAVSILPGTLFPYTAPTGASTDMKVILTLLRPHPSRERLVAMILLAREILAGTRPRDWSDSLLRKATELRDDSAEELRARITAYYRDDDAGLLDDARAQLRRAVEVTERLGKRRGVQGEAALMESAYVAALDKDLALAERWLEVLGDPSEAILGTYARVLGAVFVLRGEREAALEQLSLAEERLRAHLAQYGGSVEYDLEKVERTRASAMAIPPMPA